MTAPGGTNELLTIRLRGLPLPEYQRSAEHSDELFREFALIAASSKVADLESLTDVPARLTALVEELRSRFSGFTVRPEAELAQALAQGATSLDVDYVVPAAAAAGAEELDALLDEADQFCRSGDLLTLTAPPGAAAFRRWFLREFVRQAGGEPPTPWTEWEGRPPAGDVGNGEPHPSGRAG